MNDAFIASIMGFAGNFNPRGWALCTGATLAISSNTALFSLIGTIYGGDGRSTMALPDLRGRAPIGAGPAPGMHTYEQGQRVGQESVTLFTQHMPSHTHTATLQVNVDVKAEMQGVNEEASTGDPTDAVVANSVYREGRSTTHPVDSYVKSPDSSKLVAMSDNAIKTDATASGTVTIANQGGNIAHENRSPSLVINWIIALQGIYPSRS